MRDVAFFADCWMLIARFSKILGRYGSQTFALYRFLFAKTSKIMLSKLQGCARLFRAFPELLYPVTYVVVYRSISPLRCAILMASHANCKVLRHDFREAEGSALLDRRAIQDCLLSTALNSSGAVPSPSSQQRSWNECNDGSARGDAS